MRKIFLACGHSSDDPLPQLISEVRAIEKSLRTLKERGLYGLLSNRAANIDDIFHTFSSEEDIQVFHYAGHANGDTLYLEEAGDIKGISELFGLNTTSTKNPLKLVFLNGCATLGQVKSLHQAGIGAVIATNRKIGDDGARIFAEQFYGTWMMEGKSLGEAFEVARSRVHTNKESADRNLVWESELEEGGYADEIPWGLYINPESTNAPEKWILNTPPELPEMLLSEIKPNPSQSLRGLVHHFRKNDSEAQKLIRNERKDPLMVLIERLPWTVGTHLRRLFAVEADHSMTHAGKERLKELTTAYTELTRFVSYLSLSMLWDAKGEELVVEPLPFEIVPTKTDARTADFVFRTKAYFEQLDRLDNSDPLELEPQLAKYLNEIDGDLRPGYLLMEEWKQALAEESVERFEELLKSRSEEKPEGLKSLVLEAESIYARFLKAALFLTQYKLHTVRSIVVDKIRNLNSERPYSHYTMSLHAAFSQLQTSLTERETATDNYCLLLTKRVETDDALGEALNLSPFYIDRSSFIGNSTNNYPAVFVLKYKQEKDYDYEYVFHYIDADVNHNYTFSIDNELVIAFDGAILPEHLEENHILSEHFERIYEQLQRLEEDISKPI